MINKNNTSYRSVLSYFLWRRVHPCILTVMSSFISDCYNYNSAPRCCYCRSNACIAEAYDILPVLVYTREKYIQHVCVK